MGPKYSNSHQTRATRLSSNEDRETKRVRRRQKGANVSDRVFKKRITRCVQDEMTVLSGERLSCSWQDKREANKEEFVVKRL